MEKRWIWPFELLDKLGEGGMGVVYRARYVKNDKIVAVKLLPDDLDQDIIKARFERELEILKTLRHPNIVYCFGGTTDGDQQFYAMELVEGGTLEDILKHKKRIPWGDVIKLTIQICSGLAYAHERGVVHRDIKPGNFLIAKNGQVKLADFGLATVADAGKLTKAGKTVGTLRYMAPEQIRGEEMSPRTDLYALGCVMFELLCGHTPFQGTAAAKIMQEHLNTPPPSLSEEVKNLPVDLEELVMDLLEKDPEDRPRSAQEVAQRLRGMSEITVKSKPAGTGISGSGSQSRVTRSGSSKSRPNPRRASRPEVAPPPPTRVSRKALAVASGLAVFLLAALFWMAGPLTQGSRSLELWEHAWHHGEHDTKIAAAKVLGELSHSHPEYVEELWIVAEDTKNHDDVRIAALEGLALSGGLARPLTLKLTEIENTDRNAVVREAARKVKRESESGSTPSHLLLYATSLLLLGGWACYVLWLFEKISVPNFLKKKNEETEATSNSGIGNSTAQQPSAKKSNQVASVPK